MEKILSLFQKYREVILYVFFGGCTTLVNILSYFVLTDLMHLDYLVSNAQAWVLSVLFAYVTNRIWVFQSSAAGFAAVFKEIVSFFGFRLFSGGVDMLIMYLAVSVLHFPDKPVKILSNVLVIVLNYIFSKLVIFRKKEKPAQE